MTLLQQVIDKFGQGDMETFAQRCYEAGQASQRERDAPYMQHLWSCRSQKFETEGYGPERVLAECTCGLAAALRSSSLTEQA